jgi:hypothetical protein
VPDLAETLFELWRTPPDERPDTLAAFAALYTDPVLINGTPMALPDFVQRARDLHQAFGELHMELVDRVQASGKLAVAFRQQARRVGTWAARSAICRPPAGSCTG